MSDQIDLLSPSLWDGVSEAGQREFLLRGQEMVTATLSLAHGADLRNTTMMGIFGAVGVALFAAGATIITGSHPSWALAGGAMTTAIGLFIASAICAVAARPVDFFISRFEPKRLIDSSARNDQDRTRVLIAVIQDRIDHNRESLARSARLTAIAMCVAAASLAVGALFFLIKSLF